MTPRTLMRNVFDQYSQAENRLSRTAGVLMVKVDREHNRATVEHDDTVASPALADLVNQIGFTARRVER